MNLSTQVIHGGNQNASGRLALKDNVSAVLHSPKAGTSIITHPSQRRVIGKHLAARLEIDETRGSALSSSRGYRAARQRHPRIAPVIPVFKDDERTLQAICAGACGYLLKE
jgi:hypothetical protein